MSVNNYLSLNHNVYRSWSEDLSGARSVSRVGNARLGVDYLSSNNSSPFYIRNLSNRGHEGEYYSIRETQDELLIALLIFSLNKVTSFL